LKVSMEVHTDMHMNTQTHTHTQTHTNTNTNTHTHTHTQTHTNRCPEEVKGRDLTFVPVRSCPALCLMTDDLDTVEANSSVCLIAFNATASTPLYAQLINRW